MLFCLRYIDNLLKHFVFGNPNTYILITRGSSLFNACTSCIWFASVWPGFLALVPVDVVSTSRSVAVLLFNFQSIHYSSGNTVVLYFHCSIQLSTESYTQITNFLISSFLPSQEFLFILFTWSLPFLKMILFS